jgi:hypothetical protein
MNVSALEDVLGGAGGSLGSTGGATNPASDVPSSAITVPVHNVNNNIGSILVSFIISPLTT